MGCCPKNSLIMNRDSNSYTFIFATIMVLVVASTLAFTASSLKSLQADNVRKEKMQNIVSKFIEINQNLASDVNKLYLNQCKDIEIKEKRLHKYFEASHQIYLVGHSFLILRH